MGKHFIYSPSRKNWLYDEYADGAGLSFKIVGTLAHEQTKFQNIKIVKTKAMGITLLLNNWIYRTEDQGSVMPEMIVHVSMNTGDFQKKKVLLIGGGDGWSLAELVKYKEIESIDMVDIDKKVIELCSKHFPVTQKAFSDERVNIHVTEGSRFVKKQPDKSYDLILVTGTEAYDAEGKPGISYSLFEKSFYQQCFKKLKNHGILLTDGQNGYYGDQFYKKINQKLKRLFTIVKNYSVTCKYIPGGLYIITIASKKFDPEKVTKTRPIKNLQYYNLRIHQNSFALPAFLIKKAQ